MALLLADFAGDRLPVGIGGREDGRVTCMASSQDSQVSIMTASGIPMQRMRTGFKGRRQRRLLKLREVSTA
ncbi:hypothetical protein [Streptomyces sp. NPDC090131]|uniref:hypothetical protein n=1 Tax=unclassified Streptomyces TaxID=2593676 RepID=UPI00324348FE